MCVLGGERELRVLRTCTLQVQGAHRMAEAGVTLYSVRVCPKLGCPSDGIGSLSSGGPRWWGDGGRRSRPSQEEAGGTMGLRLL